MTGTFIFQKIGIAEELDLCFFGPHVHTVFLINRVQEPMYIQIHIIYNDLMRNKGSYFKCSQGITISK